MIAKLRREVKSLKKLVQLSSPISHIYIQQDPKVDSFIGYSSHKLKTMEITGKEMKEQIEESGQIPKIYVGIDFERL